MSERTTHTEEEGKKMEEEGEKGRGGQYNFLQPLTAQEEEEEEEAHRGRKEVVPLG